MAQTLNISVHVAYGFQVIYWQKPKVPFFDFDLQQVEAVKDRKICCFVPCFRGGGGGGGGGECLTVVTRAGARSLALEGGGDIEDGLRP